MKINELLAEEKRDKYCSDKCCGSDVKAEDCKCPPTCKHCNCNDPTISETTAAAVATVAAPVGGMVSRNNTGKNALDSDQNLMGGPKRKKKKRNNG